MSQAYRQDYELGGKVDKTRMKVLKIVTFYLIYLFFLGFMHSASVSLCFSNIDALIEKEIDVPPLSLSGVVVAKNNNSSVAVLKNEETGKTVIMTVGESIYDMELTHVFEDGVILKKGKEIYWLLLEKMLQLKIVKDIQSNSRGIEKVEQVNNSSPEMELVRSEVQERVKRERALILRETSVVPNYVDGKIDGFKVIGLPKNSIASEVGIYKDDVIKEVNGVKLNTLSALVILYSKISLEKRCEVLIERDKKLIRQVYILK